MFNFLTKIFSRSQNGSQQTLRLQYIDPDPHGMPPDYGNLYAFLGETKVGSATFWASHSGVFNLQNIEVFGDEKGKGYGTNMLERLIAEAKKLKCTCFIFQGVDPSNTRAIQLYSRLGAQAGKTYANGKIDYVITPL